MGFGAQDEERLEELSDRPEEIEAEEETAEKFDLLSFCEEAVSLLLMAYLFIVFTIYPFYMQNGYNQIGAAKFNFYRDITAGAFLLIIPLAALTVFLRFRERTRLNGPLFDRRWGVASNPFRRNPSGFYKGLSVTDLAMLTYAAGVVVSYCFSQFKPMALWGEKGWNMGIVTQLLLIVSYFLVSRFWEFEGKVLLAFLAASFGVFTLGLLNRFSIYPIQVPGATREFISTLGNINWYSGYWSVLFPIGFVLYWFTDKKGMKAVTGLYTAAGIATGVSQGSNSAFIVIAGLYLLLFCLSFRDLKRMRHFFELALLFCITCQGLRLWRILLPENFDYYEGTLCSWITMTRVTLYAAAPLLLLYLLLTLADKKKHMDIRKYKMLRQIIVLVLTVAAGVYLMLLILNSSIQGGIRFMGQQSVLVFNEFWGSSRGGTWSAGASLFRHMTGLQKLTGVGPDCFGSYLYILPDVTERVMDQFGTSRLSNAHNELLTVLVNNGIIGLVGYAGIFASVWFRFIYRAERALPLPKKKRTDTASTVSGLSGNAADAGNKTLFLYVFAVSAFAYTIHNIVSFQQILSTPFVFLLIGMGERLMRELRHFRRLTENSKAKAFGGT